ncbi:MAG: hypothetical protein ACR2GT_06525 [Gaiellaceae bacterium]
MRKLLENPWVVRGFTAVSAALLVIGAFAYVQSRPDPSPATNTTTFGRDFELPVTTNLLTAADLPKNVRQVAGEFILAAAGRENLAKAWKLTHPELRVQCGCSYKHWLTGDIPVQYYPPNDIDTASFAVDEITPNEIFMRVLLVPKKGAKVKPQVFDIGLKGNGSAKQKTWRVNYWAPRSSIPVPAAIDGG